MTVAIGVDPLILRARTATDRLPPRAPNPDPELDAGARELFDLAPVSMQVVDADGYVLHANPASPRTFGLSVDELVGMHVSQLTHPADLGEDAEFFRRLVAGEIPRYSVRKRYVTGFGDVIWALTTVTRFTPGSDGRPRLLGQVQNLTNVPGFAPPGRDAADADSGVAESSLDVPAWESAAFRAALDRQLARGRDHGEHASLVVVELEPQDERLRGHAQFAPSEQHAALGVAIMGRLKGADIVGRIDRRRFAIVQPYAGPERAAATARQLVCAIVEASSQVRFGVPLRVTAVVAGLPTGGATAEGVLSRLTRELLDALRDRRGHAVVEVEL